MIGNDVIDLARAASESDWRRKGFLEKLFCESEIQLIRSSENSEISVWSLWSRKEAAYKIFNRQTQIRAFNPLYFECSGLGESTQVWYGRNTAFCKTEITANLVHTVAVAQSDWFSCVREVTINDITKIKGLPFFRDGRTFPASVSHHGAFLECRALVGDGFDVDLSL